MHSTPWKQCSSVVNSAPTRTHPVAVVVVPWLTQVAALIRVRAKKKRSELVDQVRDYRRTCDLAPRVIDGLPELFHESETHNYVYTHRTGRRKDKRARSEGKRLANSFLSVCLRRSSLGVQAF